VARLFYRAIDRHGGPIHRKMPSGYGSGGWWSSVRRKRLVAGAAGFGQKPARGVLHSPGHYYDVMGACTESPQPKNQLDRILIHQGQNESTFLISWRSPQMLNRSLCGQAARLVFGGGALSLVCLIILLAKLGLF
jgi:hypothetical protein